MLTAPLIPTSKGTTKQLVPGISDDYFTLRGNMVKGSSSSSTNQTSSDAASKEGDLMGNFQKLLKERAGIRDENIKTQEEQLQRMNTQKNNAAVQNQYKMRDNLVSVMQQLLDNSRRTVANSARIFT